jgi:hypothetical protein
MPSSRKLNGRRQKLQRRRERAQLREGSNRNTTRRAKKTSTESSRVDKVTKGLTSRAASLSAGGRIRTCSDRAARTPAKKYGMNVNEKPKQVTQQRREFSAQRAGEGKLNATERAKRPIQRAMLLTRKRCSLK